MVKFTVVACLLFVASGNAQSLIIGGLVTHVSDLIAAAANATTVLIDSAINNSATGLLNLEENVDTVLTTLSDIIATLEANETEVRSLFDDATARYEGSLTDITSNLEGLAAEVAENFETMYDNSENVQNCIASSRSANSTSEASTEATACVTNEISKVNSSYNEVTEAVEAAKVYMNALTTNVTSCVADLDLGGCLSRTLDSAQLETLVDYVTDVTPFIAQLVSSDAAITVCKANDYVAYRTAMIDSIETCMENSSSNTSS